VRAASHRPPGWFGKPAVLRRRRGPPFYFARPVAFWNVPSHGVGNWASFPLLTSPVAVGFEIKNGTADFYRTDVLLRGTLCGVPRCRPAGRLSTTFFFVGGRGGPLTLVAGQEKGGLRRLSGIALIPKGADRRVSGQLRRRIDSGNAEFLGRRYSHRGWPGCPRRVGSVSASAKPQPSMSPTKKLRRAVGARRACE